MANKPIKTPEKKALKVLDQHLTMRVIKPGHHKYLAWEDSYILEYASPRDVIPISKEEYDILKAIGIPDREEE